MLELSQRLLSTLQLQAERFGLEQVETEELTAWASSEMENPSLNSAPLQQTLARGCKELSLTTKSKRMQGAFTVAMLQLHPGCRFAVVIDQERKVPRVIAYLNNRHNRS